MWLCSRCTGLYPALVLGLFAQAFFGPGPGWYDAVWLSLPVIPAVVDWAGSRLGWWKGNNAIRLSTGILLGFGMSRTVYLNAHMPYSAPVLMQLGLLMGVVLFVELFRQLRPGRRKAS